MQTSMVVTSLKNVWNNLKVFDFKPKLKKQHFYGFLVSMNHEFYGDMISFIYENKGFVPYGHYCRTYHEDGKMTGYFVFGVPVRQNEVTDKDVKDFKEISQYFPPYLKFGYSDLCEEQTARSIVALVEVRKREDYFKIR